MLTAKNAAQARIADIQSKQQPAADQINAARQQDIQKLQRSMAEKNIALQTIKGLVQSGHMDPIQAKKAEYKMVGVNWEPPKSQVATLEQEKAALGRDIRAISKVLEDYGHSNTWFRRKTFASDPHGRITDMTTGKKRAATKEETEEIEQLKKMYAQKVNDYQAALMQLDPRFKSTIERDRQNREASDTLTGGEQPNLETGIRSAVDKQNKGKTVRMRSPDGQVGAIPQKNVAAALAQGFTRVK